MALIAGAVLGLGLLWIWITGHWFGRLVAFVLTWVPLSLCYLQGYRDRSDAVLPILASGAALWLIASVPYWVRALADRRSQADDSLELHLR